MITQFNPAQSQVRQRQNFGRLEFNPELPQNLAKVFKNHACAGNKFLDILLASQKIETETPQITKITLDKNGGLEMENPRTAITSDLISTGYILSQMIASKGCNCPKFQQSTEKALTALTEKAKALFN